MAEFALDLDHRAITLMRRAADGGWDPVADAPLDAPDLDARLRGLREAGEALGGGPVEVDLVIPASQVSVLEVDLEDDAEGWPALDARARRAAVARSLERSTGQDADALAFDWHGEPPRLRLAVVAAETLKEAESFARGYGFGAARFRAWPDPDSGLPAAADFGSAALAPAAAGPEPGPMAPRAAERVAARVTPEPSAAPAAAPTPPADEAEAMTVFGARRGSADRGRGGPRKALLAGGIAAALAIATAAALTLMPDAGGPEIEAGAVEEGARVAEAPGASPPPEPRPFAAEPVVVPVPPAGGAPTPAQAPLEDALEDTRLADAPEASAPEATAADRARAAYAATGIWRSPPAAPAPPEPTAAAGPAPSAPPAEATLLAAALPAPAPEASLDAPPAAMPPLPPPDAAFKLSEDGRVEATPEGAPTPDGITVYAAAPPRRPPPRPPETVLPPDEAFQDPALADARPRARPEEEMASAAVEVAAPAPGQADAAVGEVLAEEAAAAAVATPPLTLAPIAPGGPVLAGSALAGRAADGTASASLFRAPDTLPEVTVAGTTIIEETTASALAVAASQRPYARPGDLAPPPEAEPVAPSAASTAAAVTVRQVAAAPVAAAAAAPAPAAPSAAPEIPTRASVARRATVENALRLNQLSLVGVFGAEGARRALVRLPSGRFEKVKVGDRIDGGRVRAIDDGRLIYARGGRNVALEMPRD